MPDHKMTMTGRVMLDVTVNEHVQFLWRVLMRAWDDAGIGKMWEVDRITYLGESRQGFRLPHYRFTPAAGRMTLVEADADEAASPAPPIWYRIGETSLVEQVVELVVGHELTRRRGEMVNRTRREWDSWQAIIAGSQS